MIPITKTESKSYPSINPASIPYEESLFVLELDVHISRTGGIITRPLVLSDGDCKKEKRYVIHDGDRDHHWLSTIINKSISDECYCAGLRPLPKFKDDGYYRYFDDAQLVLNAYIKWIKWMKNLPEDLPKKMKKQILKQWDILLHKKAHPDWERIKASMNGIDVKLRRNLSPLTKDCANGRDFLDGRSYLP